MRFSERPLCKGYLGDRGKPRKLVVRAWLERSVLNCSRQFQVGLKATLKPLDKVVKPPTYTPFFLPPKIEREPTNKAAAEIVKAALFVGSLSKRFFIYPLVNIYH